MPALPYAAVELSIGVWRYAQGCFAWRILSRPKTPTLGSWLPISFLAHFCVGQ
jgi:hypothetical protein